MLKFVVMMFEFLNVVDVLDETIELLIHRLYDFFQLSIVLSIEPMVEFVVVELMDEDMIFERILLRCIDDV